MLTLFSQSLAMGYCEYCWGTLIDDMGVSNSVSARGAPPLGAGTVVSRSESWGTREDEEEEERGSAISAKKY